MKTKSKKVRIHQLSKQLGIRNEELIQYLNKEGIEVSSHAASIDEETAQLIIELINEDKAKQKKTVEKDEVEKKGEIRKVAEKISSSPSLKEEEEEIEETDRVVSASDKKVTSPQKRPEEKRSGFSDSSSASPKRDMIIYPTASQLAEELEDLDEEADLLPLIGGKMRHIAPMPRARKKIMVNRPAKGAPVREGKTIYMKPPIIVKELATTLGLKVNALIMELMKHGVMANINQPIETELAVNIAKNHGFDLILNKRTHVETTKEQVQESKLEEIINPEDIQHEGKKLEPRPPIVTFMGHVDHGKTSLQDKIRHTNVAAREAGGISQHVGASQITWKGQTITFIDTPGHEAFTAMRARGSSVTDIVVLVVAADDGFMPQTEEALSHARAAKVPIIVAVNKMDLPTANFDRVLRQMSEHGLLPEIWGGDVAAIPVSAITGAGLEDLLDRICLEAEMLELKAYTDVPGKGVVLEAEQLAGFGPAANVIVKEGTFRVGDVILCGQYYGRIKVLIDANNNRVQEVKPGKAIKLIGLNGIPPCGLKVVVMKSESEAREIAEKREYAERQKRAQQGQRTITDLTQILAKTKDEKGTIELKVIIKGDTQGTTDAVAQALQRLNGEKVKIEIVHQGTGPISEGDVMLASASNAIIVGFHIKSPAKIQQLAKEENVEIYLFNIIYELIDKIKSVVEERLEPEYRMVSLGKLEILQIFNIGKKEKAIGGKVLEGIIRVGAHARVLRGNTELYKGNIISLRRFQDDVKEVKAGLECGIRLDNFRDFEPGDIIEVYDYEKIKVSLS